MGIFGNLSHVNILSTLLFFKCQEFGHILRASRGLYLSIEQKGRIRQVLDNWKNDVRGIVVTDGERILGLGDLGAFGMGIPIGKSELYTACAGVHPNLLLPVTIDVGTSRESLKQDPLYTGIKQPRVRGPEYDELIDEFVHAVKDRWGETTLIQWEDFGNLNAHRFLVKYQDKACTFNDDIQGTASVTLAGILASNRLSGKKLSDHTILLVGAGEAGLGIANLIAMAMSQEGDMSEEEARKNIFLIDSRGLITKDRPSEGITDQKAVFAHEHRHIDNLTDAVKDLKPSILIGVTAQPGIFTEEIVKDMAASHENPLIFPLSNPTSKAECTAEDAYQWTNGKCIFASGSPFPPVRYNGRTYVPGQGNNSYIFPGVALAIISTGSRRVTNQMFLIAAQVLTETLTQTELQQGSVYPPLTTIRSVSAKIAAAVAEEVYRKDLATVNPKPPDLLQFMMDQQYDTTYPIYSTSK
jgi:malate dehydrogenase (oxaloacetate-decarboxylating)(NADP+)